MILGKRDLCTGDDGQAEIVHQHSPTIEDGTVVGFGTLNPQGFETMLEDVRGGDLGARENDNLQLWLDRESNL